MSHAKEAKKFTANVERMQWHDKSLWGVRQKRDMMSKSLPEWEELRTLASQIKTHTMQNWEHYLQQFEAKATQNGITVHYASDAQAHNEIVHGIIAKSQGKKVIKSKSMLTEECHLNSYLEERGIEVVDSDLGERIIQLRNEPPSHIVMPAIHLKKEEISETFHEHLHTEKGNADPIYLTRSARAHLREQFLQADVAITGVNFAISDSGGVVVCTNEGNADMGVGLAKVHIACMGMEKLIPSLEHLGVFTRLLARSATGQPITTYTSHFLGAREGAQMHIVIVDNERSSIIGREKFRNALNCIRCGACMNTCPVYRRSGGHSYNYVIPGPIGSILGALRDNDKYSSLPYACSLCGSCSNVCPVKIDLANELYEHRQEIYASGNIGFIKRNVFKTTALIMEYTSLFDFFGFMARKVVPWVPKFILSANPWGKHREMPTMPEKSFKQIYREKYKNKSSKAQ